MSHLESDTMSQIVTEKLKEIPRIFQQEGVFIQCDENSVADIHKECIDRFYFQQNSNLAYRGAIQSKT